LREINEGNSPMHHLEMMKAISNGDRKAFQDLYNLFCDKVYNTAMGYVQDKQDAEEVTQDVFTNIFRNAAKFKGKAAVSTWIYRITVNASLNLIKKRKRRLAYSIDESIKSLSDFEHPGILLEKKENAKVLFKVIDTLKDNQKTVFILSYIEQLPRQEVADIMELSLKAVESLLQRAKKNLRGKLEQLYPNRKKNND